MICLHEIGIASQGHEGGWTVRENLGTEFIFQQFDIAKALPGEFGTEIFPDPFRWIEFWAMRGLKQEGYIVWNAQSLGCMRAGIIQQQDVKTVRVGCGKLIDKDLHVGGIQLRQDEPERIPAIWVDTPVEPAATAIILGDARWFDAPSRNPTATDRTEIPAAFVLGKHANRQTVGRREERRYPVSDVCFERGDGVRVFFLGIGRGTLGFPPNRCRTRCPTASVVMVTPCCSHNQTRISS